MTISLATLANGASQVFTLVTQVSNAAVTGGLTNMVSVAATTPDPSAANNTASATVSAVGATPTPTVTLIVTPTSTPATATPSQTPKVVYVPPVVPQVIQNPGAIAAVGARPLSTPTPRAALAPAASMPAAG